MKYCTVEVLCMTDIGNPVLFRGLHDMKQHMSPSYHSAASGRGTWGVLCLLQCGTHSLPESATACHMDDAALSRTSGCLLCRLQGTRSANIAPCSHTHSLSEALCYPGSFGNGIAVSAEEFSWQGPKTER